MADGGFVTLEGIDGAHNPAGRQDYILDPPAVAQYQIEIRLERFIRSGRIFEQQYFQKVRILEIHIDMVLQAIGVHGQFLHGEKAVPAVGIRRSDSGKNEKIKR